MSVTVPSKWWRRDGKRRDTGFRGKSIPIPNIIPVQYVTIWNKALGVVITVYLN